MSRIRWVMEHPGNETHCKRIKSGLTAYRQCSLVSALITARRDVYPIERVPGRLGSAPVS